MSAGTLSPLFDAMLVRDREAIARLILGSDEPVGELFDSLVRFSVLSFTPSEHGRGSFLSVVAARELADGFPLARQLAVEAAVYVAATRAPWSEPPIAEPPPPDPRQRLDSSELLDCVLAHDRLRGERWLSGVLSAASNPAAIFFQAAAAVDDGTGQSIAVAIALWKIASKVPGKVRFSILRNAIVEWTQLRGAGKAKSIDSGLSDWTVALEKLSRQARDSGLNILALQRVIALDAARALAEELELPDIAEQITRSVSVSEPAESRPTRGGDRALPSLVYRFPRDYGCYLQLSAIAARLRGRVDEQQLAALRAAAAEQLESESFEEWTFA